MADRREITADPSDGLGLGESRSRVLEALQTSDVPLGVTDVAAQVGLHSNTARFHLDGLVEQGLAQRTTEDRDVPGRPRAMYSAVADRGRVGRRSYRLLAQILAGYLAAHTRQPEKAALAAGEEWGRYMTERPPPFQRVDAVEATRQLTETLEDIGFAPEAVTTGRKREILLRHCPFREVAEQDTRVVCTVHLGLMRGMLTELGAPLEVARLDPFVEPQLCVARLGTRTGEGGSRPRAT
jgi:predicted ArsR family transcriptional regulator